MQCFSYMWIWSSLGQQYSKNGRVSTMCGDMENRLTIVRPNAKIQRHGLLLKEQGDRFRVPVDDR